MIKVKDFTLEMVQSVCEALNKGDEIHIKKERDNIVIVRERRKVVIKSPISE